MLGAFSRFERWLGPRSPLLSSTAPLHPSPIHTLKRSQTAHLCITALRVLKESFGCPVITRARLFRPKTCKARPTDDSLTVALLSARPRRQRRWVDLGPPGVLSVVPVVAFGGSRGNLVASQVTIRRVVAWVGDTSVEALLPEGGRSLQLPCSGGSSVSGVHADGGTPDGDFTKEGRGRVAARRCPHRLRAVLGGVASNLSGEANHQVGPRGQVLAPNVMIMKRFRYAGKPG